MARALPMPTNSARRSAVSLTFELRDMPLPTELQIHRRRGPRLWAAYVGDYGIEWLTLDSAIAALRPFRSPITSPTEPQLAWYPLALSWQPANRVELHRN